MKVPKALKNYKADAIAELVRQLEFDPDVNIFKAVTQFTDEIASVYCNVVLDPNYKVKKFIPHDFTL